MVEAWGPPKVEGWEGSSAAGSGQATVAASAPDCEVVKGREQGESDEWVGTAKTKEAPFPVSFTPEIIIKKTVVLAEMEVMLDCNPLDNGHPTQN